MLKKNTRRKYNDIFEKRFNKETNLSTTPNNAEFFTDYINRIFEEYKNIIISKKNNNDNSYIKREKIRLETNIKNLENQKFDFTSIIISFMIIAISIFTFGMNQASDRIELYVENALQLQKKVKKIEQFRKWSLGNVNSIEEVVMFVIICFGILIVSMAFINDYKSGKNNIRIAFNRMCLKVLNEFDDELNKD